MVKYYAVTNLNGPISYLLNADNQVEAEVEWESMDDCKVRSLLDNPVTDIEHDFNLSIDSELVKGMDEASFHEYIVRTGATHVGGLKDGWMLYEVSDK
jgi:hypothetical protein